MRGLYQSVRGFLKAEDGPTAVEYAVMLALIIVVCITAITAMGTNANKVFSNVALNTAVSSS
jgi:pilus assembly protein Flp/PilA